MSLANDAYRCAVCAHTRLVVQLPCIDSRGHKHNFQMFEHLLIVYYKRIESKVVIDLLRAS